MTTKHPVLPGCRPTALIVDDEAEIRDMIDIHLSRHGFSTLQADSGEQALHLLAEHAVSVVLLDILMEGMNGYDTCRRIREQYTLPILFLSAKQQEADRVRGLTLGADDFIPKPFSLHELLARVQAQLRRVTTYNAPSPAVFQIGELCIYLDSHRVTIGDQEVKLTAKEFEILQLLAQQRGTVVSIETIYETIWQQRYMVNDNSVMVHVANLRQKIEPNPRQPQYVKTVWGFGYKL